VENEKSNAQTEARAEDAASWFEEGYAYSRLQRGDIRKGTVISITERGAIVDLGVKRDGVIPAQEIANFSDEERENLKEGAEVYVLIVRPEDAEGNMIVSMHQANLGQDWVLAEELMGSGAVWEGRVVGTNRGGLVVQFGQIRAFVPASHVSNLPHGLSEAERQQRLQELVGQSLGFKVIEVNRQRRRLVLSQREAQREWRDRQKERLLSDIREGEVRTGTVTGLRDFGAFVDLGGADGLIHVSELSWGRVKHPREVLKIGDTVKVVVLKIDQENKRISLSLKRAQPSPWDTAEERYRPGQLVEGVVTRLMPFGAFVELEPGVEGLLHLSQVADPPPGDIHDALNEGDRVLAKVIAFQPERQRIGLSLRRVSEEEQADWYYRTQEQAQALQHNGQSGEPAEPEAGEPEAGEPEAGEPEAGEAEATEPEATEPEAAAPEAAAPEAAAPEAAEPETAEPETALAGGINPEPGVPEAGEPAPTETEPDEMETGETDETDETGGVRDDLPGL
jgi:small subunit ribosomal protein S1